MPRQRAKWDDTHRFIRLLINHTGSGEDFTYVDIAKELSALNHRFYRQGCVYHIANMTVHDSSGDLFMKVNTLPNTWGMSQAWKLGLENWIKMNRMAMPDWSEKKGRYSDFKVLFSSDMDNDADKPSAKDTEDDTVSRDEWVYSEFVTPDGTTSADVVKIHMMGNSVGNAGSRTYVGLLQEYNNFRNLPHGNTAPEQDANLENHFYYNLYDSGTHNDEVIQAIIDDNDSTPYDRDDLVGQGANMNNGLTVRECALDSTHSSIAYMGGCAVPLGLLCIETKSSGNNTVELLIELAPGDYKGVRAEAMGKVVESKLIDMEWKVV